MDVIDKQPTITDITNQINNLQANIGKYKALIKRYPPIGRAPIVQLEQRVYGNDGSVSCKTYCAGTDGKSWNNELPASWAGAVCKSAGVNNDQDCNHVAGSLTQCVCQRNDKKPYAL